MILQGKQSINMQIGANPIDIQVFQKAIFSKDVDQEILLLINLIKQ